MIAGFALSCANTSMAQCTTQATDINEYLPGRLSGGVDFTIIGGSQNDQENNSVAPGACSTFRPNLSTTGTLNIPAGDNIVAAYLYWSGIGNRISTVRLNNTSVSAQRCWDTVYDLRGTDVPFFSAFANVTALVQATGNGTYTLEGLDNSSEYASRCANDARSVLYGGWAMVVMYENAAVYDDFTIFLYDGFYNFQNDSFNVNIQTNVFDKFNGSHVGVVAWEGDKDPFGGGQVDRIELNNELLPSNGYTDPDNIFNGTNSFANPVDNNFFNADIDDFDASDVVEKQLNTPGANFNFRLSSGQDLVLLNTLVFRIPNEAPDARIQLPDVFDFGCVNEGDPRTVTFDYTYFNDGQSTNRLFLDTPVGFYLNDVNGTRVGNDLTDVTLNPGESDVNTATITLPIDYTGDFKIIGVIDDPQIANDANGTVLEINENNNTHEVEGFVDQNYYDLQITVDKCDGESYDGPNGTKYTTDADIDFDLKTKRGQCDSTGVVYLRFHPVYDQTFPFEICEGEDFNVFDDEVVSPEPRVEPYLYEKLYKTNTYGCDSLVTLELTVKPHGRSFFDRQICLGEKFILADGKEIDSPGLYTTNLPGRAANGCDSVITTTLHILDLAYPTAFTPNANGQNDGFRALQPQVCPLLVSEYHLRIYNRWGELVYESFDVNEPWDGLFGNELSESDLYLWIANYTAQGNIRREQKGGVTLIR